MPLFLSDNDGRFINEDTNEGQINNPLSLNLYTYAWNNPIKFIDKTGHEPAVGVFTGSPEDIGNMVVDAYNSCDFCQAAVDYYEHNIEGGAITVANEVRVAIEDAPAVWAKTKELAGTAWSKAKGWFSSGEASQLYRRTANTGAFKDLAVPMQLKEVENIASQAGIGLDGIKIRIVRDPELVGKGLYGWADPKGKVIELYPDAFTDTENLVKTLGHERTHIYQTKTFGAPDGDTIMDYEKGAYGSEESWWEYYQRNGR